MTNPPQQPPQQQPQPTTPYEVVRAQMATLIASIVASGIPITQAEFTSAFLASAAEGAVLQGLSVEQFATLATDFFQDAAKQIAAAGVQVPPT